MISKLSLLIVSASATIANTPTAAGDPPATTAAAKDCMSCLIHGGNVCVAAANQFYGVVGTNPNCVTAETTCDTSTFQIDSVGAASGWTTSTPFAKLMQCPQLSTVCAGTAAGLTTTLADTSAQEVTITPVGNLAAESGCAFRLKTTCGSPYISTGSSTPSATDLDSYIFHYTNDGRSTSPVVLDATGAGYPALTATPIDVSEVASANKEIVASTSANEYYIARMSDTTAVLPDEALIAYNDYLTKSVAYIDESKVKLDEFNKWALFSWMWFAFKPTYPTYIGVYTGMKWSSLTTIGGWGDMSYQPIAAETTIGYQFGIAGTGDGSVSSAADINLTDCVERNAIVLYYGRAAVPKDNAAFKFKSMAIGEMAKKLAAPAPTDALEAGAVAKMVGVAALATTAYLF